MAMAGHGDGSHRRLARWPAAAARGRLRPDQHLRLRPARVPCTSCRFTSSRWSPVASGRSCSPAFAITRSTRAFSSPRLFALILPATIPLWQVALGITFGVVIGKEVFGGTGKNFLNPALTGRAFLFFAYPGDISGDAVWTAVDGFSGATALGVAAIEGMEGVLGQRPDLDAGLPRPDAGLDRRNLTLRLPARRRVPDLTRASPRGASLSAVFSGLIIPTLLFTCHRTAATRCWRCPGTGIWSGRLRLRRCSWQPIRSAPPRPTPGRWIFGLLIGFMTWLIRVINPAFPEGIMLAILFANVFAPVIDYFVVQANVKRRLKRNV